MPSKIFSGAILGLDAKIIEVEVEVSYGLRAFTIVGLPDKAVEESKERIGAALKNSGFKSPHSQPERVLVNLAPADLKKEGSLYDLPIALGYLLASKKINFDPQGKIFFGELALNGGLRPVKGILAFALKAKKEKFSEIILPKKNWPEAALVKGLKVVGLESLREVIEYLKGEIEAPNLKIEKGKVFQDIKYPVSLGWIKGQEVAKRALEISAAGGHHLLMMGPPGAGKTLLAKSICSILPKMSFREALEVTKIYSVAGLLTGKFLITERPFRSPHHTSSEVALIGGGNPPKPGEITLAHRGILFLDEFPEFHRDVLESLRQPIEEGKITISRARNRVVFPAKFTLICATNPCPCGFYNDPQRNCTCTPSQIQKYRRKLSGPLMDRIDLFVEVSQLKYEKLIKEEKDVSFEIRKKVEEVREIQKERFKKDSSFSGLTNSEMEVPQIKKYCQIPQKSHSVLRKYVDSGKLSPRGFHRVLKVARTIADLENSEKILDHHLSEALMYRIKEFE